LVFCIGFPDPGASLFLAEDFFLISASTTSKADRSLLFDFDASFFSDGLPLVFFLTLGAWMATASWVPAAI
jgi:hypothetical protein